MVENGWLREEPGHGLCYDDNILISIKEAIPSRRNTDQLARRAATDSGNIKAYHEIM